MAVQAKRKQRAELIVTRSRKSVETMRPADSRVYEGACAAIRSSFVAGTTRAQEELLEEGPFDWDRVPVSPARRWAGAPDQPSPGTFSDGDDAFPRKRGDVFVRKADLS